MRDFARGLGSWGRSARVALLLGFCLACACSLTLEDYRFVDPEGGGAGGSAGRDEPGVGGAAGSGVTPVDNDRDASVAGSGGTGATGGSSAGGSNAGGSGGASPARVRATWDEADTLWDTAIWN